MNSCRISTVLLKYPNKFRISRWKNIKLTPSRIKLARYGSINRIGLIESAIFNRILIRKMITAIISPAVRWNLPSLKMTLCYKSRNKPNHQKNSKLTSCHWISRDTRSLFRNRSKQIKKNIIIRFRLIGKTYPSLSNSR